jgi:hypothetical protein
MTIATEEATERQVQASLSAFEFREAAWRADEGGSHEPDASALSDAALFVVMRYPPADLPSSATTAVEAEATRRGLTPSFADRWLPWAVLAMLGIAGVVIAIVLLAG